MADHDLDGQLRRIRELTERMARVQDRTAELSAAFERDRVSARQGPLQEIRDLRTYSSFRPDHRDHAHDDGERHSPRSASRRRRR